MHVDTSTAVHAPAVIARRLIKSFGAGDTKITVLKGIDPRSGWASSCC
jgi:hypothetical protein